jgi:hypothetical protein
LQLANDPGWLAEQIHGNQDINRCDRYMMIEKEDTLKNILKQLYQGI